MNGAHSKDCQVQTDADIPLMNEGGNNMDHDTSRQLDDLVRRVGSEEFLKETSLDYEWGGADVVIGSRLDDDIKAWLGDPERVNNFETATTGN